jgi:hypothetical protein
MRVGLPRWVDSNFLIPEQRSRTRGFMVELHHDGTTVVCTDLSWRLNTENGIPLNTVALSTVVHEAVALIDTFRPTRDPDSPAEITATVAVKPMGLALIAYGPDFGGDQLVVMEETRRPKRLLPAVTELPPVASDGTLRSCARELESGLLNQFGIQVHHY